MSRDDRGRESVRPNRGVHDRDARGGAAEAPRATANLLNTVQEAVIVSDIDGVVVEWNSAAERLFGYSKRDMLGRNVLELSVLRDPSLVQAVLLGPTRERGEHDLVIRARGAAGRELMVQARMSLRRDEQGVPQGYIAFVREISDRVHAKEIARAPEEELQVILDSVPALIWYKDRDNRCLRVNRAAAAALGMVPAEMEGRSTFDLYPDEATLYHQADLEVIRSGQPMFGIVEQIQNAAGEKRWFRTDKVPYRNALGEIIGVIVFAVDITERVQAESALRAARDELERRVEEGTQQLASAVESLRQQIVSRQRSEERMRQRHSLLAHLLRLRTAEGMAVQLAHEINQPLAAISNYAGGLMNWLNNPSPDLTTARFITDQIRGEALRTGEIVHRLRSLVRKQDARREDCDLANLVRDAVQLVHADANNRGVVLHLTLETQLPSVFLDPVQIQQVVVNLLGNGLDAIGPDAARREITVRVEPGPEGGVCVLVRDSGTGLGSVDVPKLFEPFVTTKSGGLGMGLWISRSIVEAHGGRIWAEPNAEGGATFAFYLPGRTPGL